MLLLLLLLEESGSCDRCFEMVLGKSKTVVFFAIVEKEEEEEKRRPYNLNKIQLQVNLNSKMDFFL